MEKARLGKSRVGGDRLKLNKSRNTAPDKHQTEVLTNIFYRECQLTELRTKKHLTKQRQKKGHRLSRDFP